MAKVVGDIAISVEAETAGLISGLNSGKVSVQDFGVKVEQMGKRIKRSEVQSRSFGGAFRNLGNVSRQTRSQIQNTAFQLQDVAVQLEMGTSMSRTLSQQLPQLAGAFGPVGAIVGVLAGVGIPALTYAFSSLGDEADDLVDKMGEVTKAKAKLNEALRLGRLGVTSEELTLLDAIAAKITELGNLEDNLASKRGGHNKRNAALRADAAAEELTALKSQLSTLRTLQDAKARLISSTRDLSASERQLGEGMQATGEQLAKNERIAELLRQGLSASAIEALELAGVDIVTGVDAAAAAAATLAANLNMSLKEALKLKALSADPLDPFGGSGPFIPKDSKPWGSTPPKTNRGGGRSSGGGASSGPSEAGLEALRKQFATEQELLNLNLQTTLTKLDEFRVAKMLKEGEYNELEKKAKADHQESLKKLEVDGQNARLQAVGGALGDLSSLMQSENKKLFKIGQAAAIAEAVVSGYGAAVTACGVATAPQQRRLAEFRVEGSNVQGLGSLVDSINEALDQGFEINLNYAE